jgi:alkylation response protein AidB-like acyl-CoA dehydrogenase
VILIISREFLITGLRSLAATKGTIIPADNLGKHKTAWQMDTIGNFAVSDKVSMCNYWANRLCCEAADRAMQVHGGLGYSRHKPFEHIYRHHRRYRITEGSEEIQMRKVAGHLFGFMGAGRDER